MKSPMLTIIPARSVWVKTLLTFIFLLVFFVPKTIFGVESEIITTSSQFNAGEHSNTESKSEEGKVKLTGDGSWSARLWGTPPLTLSEGTTLTSDGTYTYMFIGRDYRLMKYLPEENRWKELAHAPRMAYSGSDMIVLGDFIYVSFGGYQKEFAKYSISKNTWTELNDLPDLINSGSGLTTDGTYVYASRGAGTDELWRYDPTAGTWSSLSSFPATISTGSDLVFDDSTGTDYIFAPRGGNTTTFYRYTIATNTWTTMAVVPGNLNDNGNMTIRNGVIYKLQGSGFDVFYKYTIATDTWSTLPVAPSVTRSVGVTYNPTEDLLYVFRGNGSYDWWKYDADDNTFLGPKDLPNTPGSGADIIYASTDTIYFRRGNNNTAFYKYTISTDTWTTLASAPDTFNDDNKGVKAGNALYFLRGGNTTTFYRYNIASDTWDTLAVTPANSQYGASLAYPGSGDYIYATRGALTTVFWRYSISGNSWDDASAADLPTGAYAGYGSRIVSDGTDIYAVTGTGLNDMYKYTIGTNTWSYLNASPLSPYWGTDMVYYNGKIYAQSGYYKTDFWEYTIASNTWHRLPYMASFYAFDLGPYNGGSLAADTDNGVLYSINGQNIYRMQSYNVTSYKYPANGTWTSDTIDLSYIASWDSISVDTTTPSDSTVTVQTRTSSDAITWSSWEAISGTDIQSDALRYVQVRAILTASTGRVDTPAVNAITITYNGDTTAPTNPTLSSASSQDVGGSAITSGQSYRHANPYFVWSGASDTESSVSG